MYKNIMIPVDLAHKDQLEKALATGADLAKHYSAKLYAVGVTGSAPGSVAHNPAEYSEKLKEFAAEQTGKRGVQFNAKAMVSHDPAVDLDDTLKKAATEIGADLVVMASHVPGFMDNIFASRAGYLASHSDLSVFVIR
ncbi:MAG: universal stress protein [Fimbriimonadaceae bacterium]|nr:universal stress protein [Alphaproteobacteria bacterium]